MDFLTLWLAGTAAHKPIAKKRLLIAAALGAFFGTLESCAGIGFGALRVLFGFLLSLAMTAAAYGKPRSAGALLLDSAAVWGAGLLIGGVMTFLMSAGDGTPVGGEERFPLAAALCFLISLAFSRIGRRRSRAGTVRLVIESNGVRRELTALIDSGLTAKEPISLLPVVLVTARGAGEFAAMLKAENPPLRLRVVPLRGIGGERVLYGFVPEKITVADRETSAVVAVDEKSESFAGTDALMPSELIP